MARPLFTHPRSISSLSLLPPVIRPLPRPSQCIPACNRLYHRPRTATALRPRLATRPVSPFPLRRHESSIPSTSTSTSTSPSAADSRDQVPAYELTFTCTAHSCNTRSTHRVTKQGYHHGTVLITCPGCKNRHLMSDHLKIFSEKPLTIEDLLHEKGQLIKRGSLSTEGDVEFWDDGTATPRGSEDRPPVSTQAPDGEGRLTQPASSSESSEK